MMSLFIICTLCTIVSFFLSYLAYNEVHMCDVLLFSLVSSLSSIISLIPPSFYMCVRRNSNLRKVVVTVHVVLTLLALVFNNGFFMELYHLDTLCSIDSDTPYLYQLVSIALLNISVIAGHLIGKKKDYQLVES